MSPIRWLTFVALISMYACGTNAAFAQDKKKAAEAAKHAAEKAEHERKKQEEAAKHAAAKAAHEQKKQEEAAKHAAAMAEHERKKQEEAAKHAAAKAAHEQKKPELASKEAMHDHKKQGETIKGPEHEKDAKEKSEARIAAARKARKDKPAEKGRQTAKDREIAGNMSKVALSLHRADHDYDWQRHEAVELVRGALHDLHEPEPNTEGKFGDMTQKKSDQILRENIPTLESIRTQLSASGAPANHKAAKVKVEEALSNLQAALRIR